MASSLFRSLRATVSAFGRSDRGCALRYYADYVRWPVLLLFLALVADKSLYYVALPFGNYLAGQIDYFSARLDLARGQNPAALCAIRLALVRDRGDAAFWQLAAEISTRLDSPDAIYCWQQVDRLRPGTFSVQIQVADSALRYQELATAEAALREVSPADQRNVLYLRGAGELAQACGDQPQAHAFFTRVEAAHPQDAETLLALTRWEVSTGTPENLAAARRHLQSLLGRAGRRTETLRLLIHWALQQHRPMEAKTWSDVLLRSSEATWADRMQRLDFLPATEQAAALETLMGNTAGSREVSAAAGWMVRHGQAEKALIWIREQPEQTQDDPVVGCARAECLGALGLWDHLREIQAADHWPGHEEERLMYLAQASVKLGAETDARAAWLEAVRACRDYRDYLTLLDYLSAGQLAAPFASEARHEVYQQLAARYPEQAWIFRALLAEAKERHDSREMEKCYAHLAALNPTDDGEKAHDAFLCVLLGLRKDQAAATLQRLNREHPEDAETITGVAFNLYLQGNFNQALIAMGALTPSELKAPETAPYLGALLAAAGPILEAQARLQFALAQPGLLDEERALVLRSQDLLEYRQAIPALSESQNKAALGSNSVSASSALSQIIEGVTCARAGDIKSAVRVLSGIDPRLLDAPRLSAYLGATMELAGERSQAQSWLELSPELPDLSAAEKLHRAVEGWWKIESLHDEAAPGLFAAYRGLEVYQSDKAFWRRDEPREMQLLQKELLSGEEVEAVQERLHNLLRHVPATPEIEGQLAYALLLQGQPSVAQQRMEALPGIELAKPELSFYYGMILVAGGERKKAEPYLRRSLGSPQAPRERVLALQAEQGP